MEHNSGYSPKHSSWERLEQVIKWARLSTNSFAKSIGILRAENLYNIKRGNYGISHDLADRIIKAYPEIDRTWLLTGVGSMLKDSANDEYRLPFYNYDAESVIAHIESIAPSGEMRLPYANDCDFVIRSHSRSMAEPQCAASDLFVKHVAPNEIAQGNEYIIVTNGEVLWRKVRTAADSEEWRLVSRNRDEFPDIFINKSKVEKAWRVVARMTVMSN
jgi:hypothetical protein